MRILENIYMIDYLKDQPVSYKKWQELAEKCFEKGFDDNYIRYINSVIAAKVIFSSKLEQKEYQNMIMELLLLKYDVKNQQTISKPKIKEIKKIQKLA